MSNSGSGAFIRDLHVTVPLQWLIAAVEHLEDGDEKAQAIAGELAGCLPRIPTVGTAIMRERHEADE